MSDLKHLVDLTRKDCFILKGSIQMWHARSGWNGVHILQSGACAALFWVWLNKRWQHTNGFGCCWTVLAQHLHSSKSFSFVTRWARGGQGFWEGTQPGQLWTARAGISQTSQGDIPYCMTSCIKGVEHLPRKPLLRAWLHIGLTLRDGGVHLCSTSPPYPLSFTFKLSLPWPRHFLAFVFPTPSSPHWGGSEQAAVWVLNCWPGSTHHTRMCKTSVSKIGTQKHTVSYFLRQSSIALLTVNSTFMFGISKERRL